MEIILYCEFSIGAQAHHWHGLFEQLQGDLEAPISTAVLVDHLTEKVPGGHEARRPERRTGANCSWKTYQRPTKNHGEWRFKKLYWSGSIGWYCWPIDFMVFGQHGDISRNGYIPWITMGDHMGSNGKLERRPSSYYRNHILPQHIPIKKDRWLKY